MELQFGYFAKKLYDLGMRVIGRDEGIPRDFIGGLGLNFSDADLISEIIPSSIYDQPVFDSWTLKAREPYEQIWNTVRDEESRVKNLGVDLSRKHSRVITESIQGGIQKENYISRALASMLCDLECPAPFEALIRKGITREMLPKEQALCTLAGIKRVLRTPPTLLKKV